MGYNTYRLLLVLIIVAGILAFAYVEDVMVPAHKCAQQHTS